MALIYDKAARAPGILRQIVVLDREIAGLVDHLASAPVVDVSWGHEIRCVRALRRELAGKARGLYDKAPPGGDACLGLPTVVPEDFRFDGSGIVASPKCQPLIRHIKGGHSSSPDED